MFVFMYYYSQTIIFTWVWVDLTKGTLLFLEHLFFSILLKDDTYLTIFNLSTNTSYPIIPWATFIWLSLVGKNLPGEEFVKENFHHLVNRTSNFSYENFTCNFMFSDLLIIRKMHTLQRWWLKWKTLNFWSNLIISRFTEKIHGLFHVSQEFLFFNNIWHLVKSYTKFETYCSSLFHHRFLQIKIYFSVFTSLNKLETLTPCHRRKQSKVLSLWY